MRVRRDVRGRRELIASVLAVAAIVCATAASPLGAAQTFAVDTTLDTTDVTPGDGACSDAAGNCSLRAAVMEANALAGADTITLNGGTTYTLDRPSPDPAGPDAAIGDLDVRETLTISGAGSGSTTIAGGAGWSDRIISVDRGLTESSVDLVVSGVTVTGGRTTDLGGGLLFTDVRGGLTLTDVVLDGNAAGDAAGGNGGGAYIRSKRLTLAAVTASDNRAGGAGGGLHIHPPDDAAPVDVTGLRLLRNHAGSQGGGLATTGLATIDAKSSLEAVDNVAGENGNAAGGGLYLTAAAQLENVTITGNRASWDGGGISTNSALTVSGGVVSGNIAGTDGSNGGGIQFAGDTEALTLEDLWIDDNEANNGAGVNARAASVALDRVAITNNRAVAYSTGGAVNYWAGGMWISVLPTATASLENVTFSGNRGAPQAGGTFTPSALSFNGGSADRVLLRNVTIAANTGTPALASYFSGGISVENTLIAGNQGGNCSTLSWITSLGGNLEQGTGSGTCNFGISSVKGDAKLGPARVERGLVDEMIVVPPLVGSAAIDAGLPSCPPADQLGAARQDGDLNGEARCDIGAYEFVPTPPSANLSLTKTDSPDPAQVGKELTYSIAVSNAGPDPAVGAAVTDTLPANVTLSSAASSPGGPCSGTATLTCPLGTLAAGASATLTIKVTPTSPGVLSNTASVSSSTADPDTGNNSATATTTVNAAPPPSADLSLAKSDSPDPVQAGQQLTYTLTVANPASSPTAAPNVVVTDTLPASVTFVSASASAGGTCSGTTTVSCQWASLAAGGSATATIRVTPTTAATLTNTASVSSSTPDPDTGNNTATATTVVTPAPPPPSGVDLKLAHAASTTFVELGGTYVLRVTVTNDGNATATNVRVTEQLRGGGDENGLQVEGGAPGGCAASLYPSTVVCTASAIGPGGSVTFRLVLKPYLGCDWIGTTGNDVRNPASAAQVLCGGGGNDTIDGGGADDTIYGYGPTGDTVTATGSVVSSEREDRPGDESAATTTGIAGPGYPDNDKDTLSGGGGNDTIDGQNGKDTLDGGFGDDTVGGGPSDDTLYGGPGRDRLEGHGGIDKLYGEGGNDWLHGGGSIPPTDQVDTGGNKLDGGAGNDDVCSNGPSGNPDRRTNCESFSALSLAASPERTIAGVRGQAGASSGSTRARTASSGSRGSAPTCNSNSQHIRAGSKELRAVRMIVYAVDQRGCVLYVKDYCAIGKYQQFVSSDGVKVATGTMEYRECLPDPDIGRYRYYQAELPLQNSYRGYRRELSLTVIEIAQAGYGPVRPSDANTSLTGGCTTSQKFPVTFRGAGVHYIRYRCNSRP